MSLFNPKLPPKAKSLILQYALFRWENAALIGGAIVLTGGFVLFQLPFAWVWPLLGVAGVAGVFWSSVTDTRANAELLLQLAQEPFDPRQIQNPELRRQVTTALEYQRRIELQVRGAGKDQSPLWERPEDTAGQLEQWLGNIFTLARRLDAYYADALTAQTLQALPREVAQIAERQQRETNPLLQKELAQTLASKRKQLETLQTLETRMKQAEFQLQQTLTALATVDGQVRLLEAEDIHSAKSEGLRADIQEQVNRLNDLVVSLNEVYRASGQLAPPGP